MRVIPTALNDCLIVEPKVHGDARGYFMELYNRSRSFAGKDLTVAQVNVSRSSKGVLRGLHFQDPFPQAKLVWVLVGEVFDVVVDLREKSSTYGQWEGTYLSEDNHRQLYVPEGFAHGFQVTSAHAVFCYVCSETFRADCDRGVHFSGAEFGVEWPNLSDAIVSDKDRRAPFWTDLRGQLENENFDHRRQRPSGL